MAKDKGRRAIDAKVARMLADGKATPPTVACRTCGEATSYGIGLCSDCIGRLTVADLARKPCGTGDVNDWLERNAKREDKSNG